MKKRFLFVAAIALGSASTLFGQTDIDLNLEHHFDGTPFVYGTTYMLNGTAVSLDRVQYYLSGFEITHDGGTITAMPDSYILASGNVSNYSLGTEAVTTLEGMNFDLGVDYTNNHIGTTNWAVGHPLGVQSPSMDWNWPSGYFFWVIDGLVDDNADGTPNQPFSLRGVGDPLLTDVNAFTGMNATGSTIALQFQVNIADWIRNIDLPLVWASHGQGPNNVQVGDNTNGETVFTYNGPVASLDKLEEAKSEIYANYELPYAPTIFYSLATKNNVDIKIYSMSGLLVLESKNQDFEGNYFIRKELESGSYLIVFSNDTVEESFKFIVQK